MWHSGRGNGGEGGALKRREGKWQWSGREGKRAGREGKREGKREGEGGEEGGKEGEGEGGSSNGEGKYILFYYFNFIFYFWGGLSL